MRIFITGVNGFIGNWLTRHLLETTDYLITGVDLNDFNLTDPLDAILPHPRFSFHKANLLTDKAFTEKCVKEADLVIPLAAIANPALYVSDPLRVFALDFESNLEIVKHCVTYKKRLIFPSTSEVYGMCPDDEFDEELSSLVLGPTRKSRWIYSSSKQLLDRVIHAYGDHQGLRYSLFRPFNWFGPRLDAPNIHTPGNYRAFTQFLCNAVQGTSIHLVDGGLQRRVFIFVTDAIEALTKIIENKNNAADSGIFNIGNPANDFNMKEIAEKVLDTVRTYPKDLQKADACHIEVKNASDYFGSNYQDVSRRVPSITRAREILGWTPTTSFDEGLRKTLDFYLLGRKLS